MPPRSAASNRAIMRVLEGNHIVNESNLRSQTLKVRRLSVQYWQAGSTRKYNVKGIEHCMGPPASWPSCLAQRHEALRAESSCRCGPSCQAQRPVALQAEPNHRCGPSCQERRRLALQAEPSCRCGLHSCIEQANMLLSDEVSSLEKQMHGDPACLPALQSSW